VIVKGRVVIFSVILIALLAFWQTPHGFGSRDRDRRPDQSEGSTSGSLSPEDRGTHSLPSKASHRYPPDPAATHRPESLGQFYLPPVHIDGLPLDAALRKLQAAYEEACRETGETPIRLTFGIPPGAERTLTVTTGTGTLDGSIRLLAALSSLTVKREGTAYLFELPEETGKPVKKSLKAPPDLLTRLKSAPPSPAGDPADLVAAFTALGVDLDPSTRLRFFPGSSTVLLETLSAADEVAVSALVGRLAGEPAIQHKLQTRIIELAADLEWTPPDSPQLDEEGVQLMMRELARIKGVDLMTMPSTVTRDGEAAKVEIVRDLISPVPGSEAERRTDKVGVVLEVTPVVLGFGQRLDLGFKATEGDLDPATREVEIVERALIDDTSFTRDASTRLHVETRPDGSRILLLVTPTLIDATGRPVRPVE
jgi:hypothetical protein